MSPAGAIGVNVAIASTAGAAQVLYPRLGKGPILRDTLSEVPSRNPLVRWLRPRLMRLVLGSPLLPRVQRRLFFGAPLPPIDPAFSFREGGQARLASSSAHRA